MTKRVVVITGAVELPPQATDAIDADTYVIAVDGGLDQARAAGISPDRLVGDLDSISADGLAWADDHIEVVRHPTDKDETDTQLALRQASDAGAIHVTMLGGGDRLDHTLAALGALTTASLADLERLDAWWDGQHIEVLHAPRRAVLTAADGSTVSLIALGGPAVVSISGVRWPLDHHELSPLDGLGVSNEVAGRVAVEAHQGVVAVFDDPSPHSPTPHQEEPPA